MQIPQEADHLFAESEFRGHVDKENRGKRDIPQLQKSIFIGMEYLRLDLELQPIEPFRDWMSYKLAEAGFDMFEETPQGLTAYCRKDGYDHQSVESILNECRSLGCALTSQESEIPWQNWNEEWEKQFEPEVIGQQVYVRADFHPPRPDLPMEIVIQPRMAFGTGHHPTTAQVMEAMLDIDFKQKTVIDMGCGTAILAVLACMLGATEATAIDNDPNAVENSIENARRNGFPQIRVIEGDVHAMQGLKADILLANINRNIILSDLSEYCMATRPGGVLITSGYYEDDLPVIVEKASQNGFVFLNKRTRNEWCCATFRLENG